MMKKLLCLLLVFGLAAACLAACGSDNTATPDETSPSEAENGGATVEVYDVETDYCTLKLPAQWKDQLKAETEEGIVHFSSAGVPLFDISFNSGVGDVLGTIQGDTNTVVSVTMYEPDKQTANYEELKKMYSAIDVIADNLAKDYDFAQGDALNDSSEDVFPIETSLTTLYYPKKWQDKVTIDVEDNAVHFAYNGIKLFDLLFGGSEGDLLGVYNGTEIRVVLHELRQGTLSDSDYSEYLGMRDAVNVIVENLEKDSQFEINK